IASLWLAHIWYTRRGSLSISLNYGKKVCLNRTQAAPSPENADPAPRSNIALICLWHDRTDGIWTKRTIRHTILRMPHIMICELDVPASVIVTYSHCTEPLSMARGR